MADSLSLAFLILLERLSPAQRAVLPLRDELGRRLCAAVQESDLDALEVLLAQDVVLPRRERPALRHFRP